MPETVDACFAAGMYPWSDQGNLWFCATGSEQTMIIMAGAAFFWVCGVILGSALSR